MLPPRSSFRHRTNLLGPPINVAIHFRLLTHGSFWKRGFAPMQIILLVLVLLLAEGVRPSIAQDTPGPSSFADSQSARGTVGQSQNVIETSQPTGSNILKPSFTSQSEISFSSKMTLSDENIERTPSLVPSHLDLFPSSNSVMQQPSNPSFLPVPTKSSAVVLSLSNITPISSPSEELPTSAFGTSESLSLNTQKSSSQSHIAASDIQPTDQSLTISSVVATRSSSVEAIILSSNQDESFPSSSFVDNTPRQTTSFFSSQAPFFSSTTQSLPTQISGTRQELISSVITSNSSEGTQIFPDNPVTQSSTISVLQFPTSSDYSSSSSSLLTTNLAFTHSSLAMVSGSSTFDDTTSEVRQHSTGPLTVSTVSVDVPFSSVSASEKTGLDTSQLISSSNSQITSDRNDVLATSEVTLNTSPSFDRSDIDLGSIFPSVSQKTLSISPSFDISDIDLTSLFSSTTQGNLKTLSSPDRSDVQLTSAFSPSSQLTFSVSASLNSKLSDDDLTLVFTSTSVVPLNTLLSVDRNAVNLTSTFPSTREVDGSDVQVSSNFPFTSQNTLSMLHSFDRSDVDLTSLFPSHSEVTVNTALSSNRSDVQLSNFPYTSQDILNTLHSVDRSDGQFTSSVPSTSQQTFKTLSSYYDRSDIQSMTFSSPFSSQSSDDFNIFSIFSDRSDSVVVPIFSSAADPTPISPSSSLMLPQSQDVISVSDIVSNTESSVSFSDKITDVSSISTFRTNAQSNYTSSESQSIGSEEKSVTLSNIEVNPTRSSDVNMEMTSGYFSSLQSVTSDGTLELLSTASDFTSVSSSIVSISEGRESTQTDKLSTIVDITNNSPVSSFALLSSSLQPSFQITESIGQSGTFSLSATTAILMISPSYYTDSNDVLSSFSFSFPGSSYHTQPDTSSSASFTYIATSSIPVRSPSIPVEMSSNYLTRVTAMINSSFSSDAAVNSPSISSNLQDLPSSLYSAIESISSNINETQGISTSSLSIIDTQGENTTPLESYISSEQFLSTPHAIFSTDMFSPEKPASSYRLHSITDSFISVTETYSTEISITLISSENTTVSVVERTTFYEGSSDAIGYTSFVNSRSDPHSPQSSDYRITQSYFSTSLSVVVEEPSFQSELISSSFDTSGFLENISPSTPFVQTLMTTSLDDLTVAIETDISGIFDSISSTPAISDEVMRPSTVESDLITVVSSDKAQDVSSLSFYASPSATSDLKGTIEGTKLSSATLSNYEASTSYFTQVSIVASNYNFSTRVNLLPSQSSNISEKVTDSSAIFTLDSATSTIEIDSVLDISSVIQQSSQISFDRNSTIYVSELDSTQTLDKSDTDFQHSMSPSGTLSFGTSLFSELSVEDSLPSVVIQSLQPTEVLSVTVEYTTQSQRSNQEGSSSIDFSLISEKPSEDNSMLSSKTDSVIIQSIITSSIPNSPSLMLSSIQTPQLISTETADFTISTPKSLDISFTFDTSFGDNTASISTMMPPMNDSSQLSTILSTDYRNSSTLSIADVSISSGFISSYPSHSSVETNKSQINTDLMTSSAIVDRSIQTFSLVTTTVSFTGENVTLSPGIAFSTPSFSSADNLLTTPTSVASFESTVSMQSESSSYEETSSLAFEQVTGTLETIPIASTSQEFFSNVGEISSQTFFPITDSTIFYTSSESQYDSFLYSDLITSSSSLESGIVTVLSDSFSSQTKSYFLLTSSDFTHTETSLSGASFVTLESRSDFPSTITFSSYLPFLVSSETQESTEVETLTPTPPTQTSVSFSSGSGFISASSVATNNFTAPSSSSESIPSSSSESIPSSSSESIPSSSSESISISSSESLASSSSESIPFSLLESIPFSSSESIPFSSSESIPSSSSESIPFSSSESIGLSTSQVIEPSSNPTFSPSITQISSSVLKLTSDIFDSSFTFSSQSPDNTNSTEILLSLNVSSISQTDINSSPAMPASSENYTSFFPSTNTVEISSEMSSGDNLLSSIRQETTSVSLEKTAVSSFSIESVLSDSYTTPIESSKSFSSSPLLSFEGTSVIVTSPPPSNTVDVVITPVVSTTSTSSLMSHSPLLTSGESEIDLISSTLSSTALPVMSSQSQDLSAAFSTIVTMSPFSTESLPNSTSSYYLSFMSTSSGATVIFLSSSLGSQVVDFSTQLDASSSTSQGSLSVVSPSLTPSQIYSDFTSGPTGLSSLGVTSENVTETMSTMMSSSLEYQNSSSLSLSITPTLILTNSTQETDVSESSFFSKSVSPSLRLSSMEDFITSSSQVASEYSVPVSIYPSMSGEESTTSIPINIGSSTLKSLVESSVTSSSSSPFVSSLPPSQLLSSSIQPSPTSSALPYSSTSISTTTPPVTVPTIDNSGNDTQYWVSVGLLVRQSVNISTTSFKTQVEQGLANAYAVAAQRQQEIDAGSFEPLNRRKRLATAENDPSVQVEVTSISREGSTSSVNVAHVVQQNGQLTAAADAVDQLSVLADQELAIELGVVVGSSAKPYIEQPVTDNSDDDPTWIIVGSGLGAAAVIIVIIIICCCCCCGKERRCCQPATETETKISDISNTHFVDEINGVNQGYVEDEPQGKSSRTLVLPSKKGKYSVQQMEEDPLYASIDNRSPVKAGKKKKSSPQKSATPQSSVASDQEDEKSNGPGKRKKSKKPKMEETDEALEMRSVYESQIASLQNNPTLQTEHYAGTDFSATGQPTIEIERDLLDNADEERKKNKQRLRERKMKEKEQESPVKVSSEPAALAYENAQKEIDKVLGPRLKVEEETKKEKKSSKSKRRDKDRNKDKGEKEENSEKDDKTDGRGTSSHPPETLEEAKQRMHKLLDDAFSLFSQSRSSMGNKVHPSPRESSDEKSSPVSQRSHASHSSKDSAKELKEPQPEEKKHTPIIVQRSHGPYDNSGLISWSPYRASDETALISLPTSETNLDAVPPKREVITTSTFSENLPTSLRPNYYTTLPGEPIVIKMQDLEQKSPPYPEEDPREEQIEHREPPRDIYSEPYYGMSSYQEIPQQSAVPNLDFTGSAKSEDYTVRSASSHLSPAVKGGNYIDVRMHSAPGRGENRNKDELDVIKQSVQPGASPEPLINSLREELMSLSMKKKVSLTNEAKGGNSSKN